MRQLLTIILLSVLSAAMAVDIHSVRYNTAGGLPANDVRSIAQDSKGYMWIGALSGLSRFDGYNYHTFHASRHGRDSLLLNNFISMVRQWNTDLMIVKMGESHYSCYDVAREHFTDYTGCGTYREAYRRHCIVDSNTLALWDNSRGCKIVRYLGEGRFRSQHYSMGRGDIASNKVSFVVRGSDGHVWIGTARGLYREHGRRLLREVADADFRAAASIDGHYYFVTRSGAIYTRKKRGMTQICKPVTLLGECTRITDVAPRNGKLLIFTDNITYEYSLSTGHLTRSRLQVPFADAQTDNNGNWIITNNTSTVWHIDRRNGDVTTVNVLTASQLRAITSYKYNVVTTTDGLIWISTNGNGIFVHNKKTAATTHLTADGNSSNRQIDTDEIISIYLDSRGNVWVCQNQYGIACLTATEQSEKFHLLNSDPRSPINEIHMMRRMANGKIVASNNRGTLVSLSENLEITTLLSAEGTDWLSAETDTYGRLWAGTRSDGLLIGGKRYKNNPSDPQSLPSNRVCSILRDNRGRMWLACHDKGICMAVPRGDGFVFRRFGMPGQDTETFYLMQDHRNRIYVATNRGVFSFSPDSLITGHGTVSRIETDPSSAELLETRALYEDSSHRLWIGTIGNGAYYADNKGKQLQFRNITINNGLDNNAVYAFTEDKSHNIWIGTQNGFTCYNPATGRTEGHLHFDKYNKRNTSGENSMLTLADGRLVIGTYGGVTAVNPSEAAASRTPGQVTATAISINGSTDDTLLPEIACGKIRLPHDHNTITIDFSTFDYNNTDVTRFAYFLKPYDRTWTEYTPANTVTYRNLPPGHYILHVKAQTGIGGASSERTLDIIVEKPWWTRWWAMALYAALAATAVTATYHWLSTIYRLRRKISIDRQLNEYKLQFFTNISHEFRTPLTLISGMVERLQQSNRQADMKYPIDSMRRNVKRMTRLINQLMEFRKMQSGKLHLSLREADIITAVYNIYIDFHETAETNSIGYSFHAPSGSLRVFFDAGYIDKIIYNILSNAFKYTPKGGSVTVSITVSDGLKITVTDTGIGVPEEKRDKLFSRYIYTGMSPDSIGIGLNLSYELARAHHGDLTYHPNPGGGSVFTLCLPVSHDVYSAEDFLAETAIMPGIHGTDRTGFSNAYHELPPVPVNSHTVMIVEDNHEVRGYLEQLLGKYFTTQSASDGEEALEHMRTATPDLIVSDVIMPRMGGIELTRRVRSDAKLSKVPVILLTAATDTAQQLKGISRGADIYLNKPFSPAVLIAYACQLINRYGEAAATACNTNATAPHRKKALADKHDKRFMTLIDSIISANLSNPEFSVDTLAEKTGTGRTNLYSVLRNLTGLTPKAYILEKRLCRAAELLDESSMTISEIAYSAGFNDPLYFTKVFKRKFDMPPSEYRGKKTSTNKNGNVPSDRPTDQQMQE